MTLTFGSLFAGIGGFDLGFKRAGMKCLWQVEIDDYANRVLEKHWPNVKRWRDVRTFPQPGFERVDVICGGFPCQDISYAGKGAGLAGERSGLFYEVIRIVREMEPRFVVLENVAALLTRGMGDVLGSLAEIGFDAEWDVLPAFKFGLPTLRRRVFIVAYDRGLRRNGVTNEPFGTCFNAALQPKRQSAHRGKVVRGRSLRNRLVPDWWHSGMAPGIPVGVDRGRGLGNAVVPQVAQWIGERIMEAVT